jgi:ATP/maltotriose-dependent transcriptional regulator MalT
MLAAVDQTPIAKIVPPGRPPGLVARPLLAERISTVLGRRLTVLVAEAGFGKSTLLTTWWEAVPCAWYTVDQSDRDMQLLARQLSDALRLRVPDLPAELGRVADGVGPEPEQGARADSLGSRLAEVLHEKLAADLVLVIDDTHELASGTASARLIEALCRHAPARLHIVLSGRRRPPFSIERLRGRGEVLEISGEQLAFTCAEVAQLLQADLGTAAAGLAGELHALAGGWPAAVVLGIEALRESPPDAWAAVLAGLDRPDAPAFAYLAEEVFASHPPEVRDLIGRAALLDEFTPALCEAVGIRGARRLIGDLARQGLFVERRQDESLALRPLIRDYALEHLALPEAVAMDVRLAAADWYASTGNAAAAIRMLLAAKAPQRLAGVLATQGQALLSAGHVTTVLDACRAVPAELRGPDVELLEGEARQVQGDWSGALLCFQRAAGGADVLSAQLAWRIGVIHHFRGELDAALAVYERGLQDAGADRSERAMLLAWKATTHWLRGDVEKCRQSAADAFDGAARSGNLRALAAAHTVLALLAAFDGDRRSNDAHYLLALRAAEDAPDVLQVIRIRTNRASHFIEEGSYREGLQELEVAIRLAELTSFASFLALSLNNRGEALFHMGQLDEALTDLEASRAKYQQIGSDMVAYPVTTIADIHRERGNLAQARAAYEEAVATAQSSGDVQGLVPALAGLATVVATDDAEAARGFAERAIAYGTGLFYVTALLAAGWVAAVAGARERASEMAALASSVAQSRRDRAGLADALALAVLSADNPRAQSGRLREAASIWREIGNPLGEAKAMLALARMESGPAAAASRREAESRLEAHGVRTHLGGSVAAGILSMVARADPTAVRVQSLGGFAVLRDGQPVKTSEWQSRRARELLKFLVARRGRPAPRPLLMEALWPDDDADRLGNRLSVALTTIRSAGSARESSSTPIRSLCRSTSAHWMLTWSDSSSRPPTASAICAAATSGRRSPSSRPPR